jgi:hypothetical protein
MRPMRATFLFIWSPLVLFLLAVAVGNAADTLVCSVIAKPTNFDNENISLEGTVAGLKETTSHKGNDYSTFKLQDPSGCGALSVFTWGHPTLSNGDQVRVEGVFQVEHHQGHYTFYNEVEATKVSTVSR